MSILRRVVAVVAFSLVLGACGGGGGGAPDTTAPAAPVLSGLSPASPSSNLAPHLTGTAEAGATLRVYAQAACAGPAVTTATVPVGGAFDLAVAAAANASTTFSAAATDAAGNASPCSGTLAYLHDDLAPATPTLAATSPASPSPELAPTLRGAAEADALVTVYGQADCTGPSLASTFAGAGGAFTTGALAVALNATTSLAATATDAAGNASGCSAALEYRHDDVAPAAPVLVDSFPPSGLDANAPSIRGVGEPGARVALFTAADCSGPEAGSGVAAADGAFAVAVAVGDNTTTTFHGRQADAAGNGSACSATSVTFVEESRRVVVTPGDVFLDASPSPLSQQRFTYAITGGPDEGVTWSVQEPAGGTITADGLYTAPASPGVYHVLATTTGARPAIVGHANVVVHHPELAGTVAWSGGPGLIFVSVEGQFGGPAVGGATVFAGGPGDYPFTVRGIASTGLHRVTAWFDAAGVERYVPAVDAAGEAMVDLQGRTVTGLALALAPPPSLPPPAAAVQTVMPGDGMAVVLFETPRDAQGRELAAAYLVECAAGAPPALPGPGATTVPAGHDAVAFVYGLQNGLTHACSVWTERGGARSAPATSAPFVAGPGAGGFTVSGTLDWAGAPPAGPLFAVLFDPVGQRAWFQRHDAPTFPLAFAVPNVPAGAYGLGFIVDAGADGRLGPTDLNTLSGGQPEMIAVAGDVGGLTAAVTWSDATLQAAVGRHVAEGGGERWDLAVLARSGARLPVSAVVGAGPDLLVPVDLGLSNEVDGGGVAFTTVRRLEGAGPAPGVYEAFVDFGDGTGAVLTAAVTAASLLDPPVPLSPVLGAAAPPRPILTWAEPAAPPLAPYAYRISLRTAGGAWVWDTDAIPPASACAAGICQVAFDFDGRAAVASLPPDAYRWDVALQDAGLNVARAEASFHVPVEVAVSPAAVSLLPGAGAVFTATVTGGGAVAWSASCGAVTPRADPLVADYVAPAAGPCTVTATSTAEPGRSAAATVTVLAVPLAVIPAAVTVGPLEEQYFTAVAGVGGVSWSATCGDLTPTADPTVVAWRAPGAAGACEVRATSTLQPGTSASAAATVAAAAQPALEPAAAVLNPGQQQAFWLVLGGVPRPATFSVLEPGGGDVDADGRYTAPTALGVYHVLATDAADPAVSRVAVVRVVSAAASPQVAVALTPPAAAAVIRGAVGFSAAVTGCGDPAVTFTTAPAEPGLLAVTGPAAATLTAPWRPGRIAVVARAACDPSKSAVAWVDVSLPTVSGTVTDPTGGAGRIYLALVSTWGEVVAGTSLAAPGPFTLRGIRWSGDYVLRAWRDTLGVGKPAPNFEPAAAAPVTVPVGASLAGADVALAAPPAAAAPPAVPFALAFPGEGTAVLFWDRIVDGLGQDLADAYHVACDTQPAPSALRTFTLGLSDAMVVVLDGPPGSTWACTLEGSAAGLHGPAIATGLLTLSAAPGGHVVSGEVDLAGPSPGGHLFVALFSEAFGLVPAFHASPTYPQPFALAGTPDGDWQLGAILDVNADGVIARTEPNLFNGRAVPVRVAGADVGGLALALPLDDATAEATTRRSVGAFGASFGVQVTVRSGVRVPVGAVLHAGRGVAGAVDLGMRIGDGGDELAFGGSVDLGATAPQPGDRYEVTVAWDDGTTSELAAVVTTVLEPPVPIAPVDPLAVPLAAPAVPDFQWAPPAAPPAGPYQYGVWVSGGGASWWRYDLPSTQLSAIYGSGPQPASPAALPAGAYTWTVQVRDQAGNEASAEARFTVSP